MNCTTKSRTTRNKDLFFPFLGNVLNEVMNTPVKEVVRDKPVRHTYPATNVVESEDRFTIELALPGYEKKEVDIKVDKNTLIVASNREVEEGQKFQLREFNYGAFSKKYTLPESVDKEKIKATFSKGLLTVSLPKVPVKEPLTITIK